MVRQDCIPYGMYQGYPASPFGINLEGMKRHGYSRAAMHAARESYKLIFREGKTVQEAVEAIKAYASALRDEQAKKVCELMCEFLKPEATRRIGSLMEQLTNNSIIWALGENSGDYLASRVFLPAVAPSRPNLKMEGIGGNRIFKTAWILGFMPANFPVRGYLEVIRHCLEF